MRPLHHIRRSGQPGSSRSVPDRRPEGARGQDVHLRFLGAFAVPASRLVGPAGACAGAHHLPPEPAGLKTDRGEGSRLGGGGTRPSMSVNPYSPANSETSRICPVLFITCGSLARPATARPTKSGVSPLSAMSLASAGGTRSGWAASFSLFMYPGQIDTAAMP